jgi:hypothetical protein
MKRCYFKEINIKLYLIIIIIINAIAYFWLILLIDDVDWLNNSTTNNIWCQILVYWRNTDVLEKQCKHVPHQSIYTFKTSQLHLFLSKKTRNKYVSDLKFAQKKSLFMSDLNLFVARFVIHIWSKIERWSNLWKYYF